MEEQNKQPAPKPDASVLQNTSPTTQITGTENLTVQDLRNRILDFRGRDQQTQNQADQFQSNDTPSDVSGVTGSSQSVRSEQQQLQESISRNLGSAAVQDAVDASDEYIDVLDKQRKRLEQNFSDQKNLINQQFDQAKQELKLEQESETGVFRNTLVALGGFLGPQAASVGALNSLAASHRSEIAALATARTEALLAAQQSFDDSSFDIAKAKAEEAVRIEDEIQKRRNDFLDNQLKLLDDIRQQEKDQAEAQNKIRDDSRAAVDKILDTFGGLPLAGLTDESKLALADMALAAGYPIELVTGAFSTIEEDKTKFSQELDIANLMIREQQLSISQSTLALRRSAENRQLQLSASEAKTLGLPRTTVGMTEQQLADDLNSTEIPLWYEEMQESDGKDVTSEDWDSFRNEIVKGSSSTLDYLSFISEQQALTTDDEFAEVAQ